MRWGLGRDATLLIAGQGVRAAGYGFTAVILGALLAARGYGPAAARASPGPLPLCRLRPPHWTPRLTSLFSAELKRIDEFVFRFNRRRSRSRGRVFYRVLELAVAHAPVRYRDLVAHPQPKQTPPSPPGRRGHPPTMDRPRAARPWRAS